MAIAIWQHIRTNAPEILSDMGAFDDGEIVDTDKKKAKKVKNLFGWIPELAQMFGNFRNYCYKKGLGRTITLNKSCIRLTTPDKIKYGGGNRVKQITMNDNWSDFVSTESNEEYGQVYEYTQTETINGEERVFSSGVAQYEPMIGGDEIALRHPKFYPGRVPFNTDNNLYFEHPVNEAYMPAPVVGYSKVTVKSLNTNEQINKAVDPLDSPDGGRGVSAVSVTEFYTAKDFPVLVDETKLVKGESIRNFNVPIFIPFLATYTRNKLAASQGYKIEMNDMHGKLKGSASYGLDSDYNVKDEPFSSMHFEYNHEKVYYNGKFVNKLVNEVPTFTIDPVSRNYVTENLMVGVEYDFFTDQHQNKSSNLSVGGNFNIDLVFPAKIPIPSWWGNLVSSKNDLRLYTTNKVIHKAGILKSTTTLTIVGIKLMKFSTIVKKLEHQFYPKQPIILMTQFTILIIRQCTNTMVWDMRTKILTWNSMLI